MTCADEDFIRKQVEIEHAGKSRRGESIKIRRSRVNARISHHKKNEYLEYPKIYNSLEEAGRAWFELQAKRDQ